MAKEKGKAKPRRERSWPQVERVYSTNYLDNMLKSPEKCFVPWSDHRKLQKKYLKLLSRYKREVKRNG